MVQLYDVRSNFELREGMVTGMKISILGVGHLGSALLEGLIKAGSAPTDILVLDKEERVLSSGGKHPVGAQSVASTADINEAIDFADAAFIVLKAPVFAELAGELRKPVAAEKTIVSFMAGVQLETLREQIGGGAHVQCSIVRAMPSLAIAVNDGITGYTAAPSEVAALFHALGYAFECKPDEIEKVAAFASCGLGFAAYLIDAFARAGEALGFSHEDTQVIAAQTFRNAVERGSFAETAQAVATKGGATEQGVMHFDASDVFGITAEAMRRSYIKMTT